MPVGETGGGETGSFEGVAVTVGVAVVVAVTLGVAAVPTPTFGGNCMTGLPCSAASMYCLKICAGTVPP